MAERGAWESVFQRTMGRKSLARPAQRELRWEPLCGQVAGEGSLWQKIFFP